MARRTATSYRGRAATAAAAGTDAPETGAATSAAPDKGLGLSEALILATTVMLLAAILLTDAYLGKRYGAGMFFK